MIREQKQSIRTFYLAKVGLGPLSAGPFICRRCPDARGRNAPPQHVLLRPYSNAWSTCLNRSAASGLTYFIVVRTSACPISRISVGIGMPAAPRVP